MYRVSNIYDRVCIDIHDTRYTIHDTRRFLVSCTELWYGVYAHRLVIHTPIQLLKSSALRPSYTGNFFVQHNWATQLLNKFFINQAIFCVAWATLKIAWATKKLLEQQKKLLEQQKNCLSNTKNCMRNWVGRAFFPEYFLVCKCDWTITDWEGGGGGNVWELHEKIARLERVWSSATHLLNTFPVT